MTREYARVKLKIWADDDFRRLPDGAQALYFRLISSPTMNLAGVADWRPNRLAALTCGMTPELVRSNADVLIERGYLIVDEATEEVLVRTFVRHDGLIKTPNIAAAMVKDYAAVASTTLRGVIVHELRRLHDDEPEMSGWRVAHELLTNASVNPSDMPSPKASEMPSPKASEMPYPIPSGNGSHIPHPTSLNQQPASPRFATDPAPSAARARRSPTKPIPEDWAPNEKHRERAVERNVDVEAEAEAFRLHAEANDRRIVKWDAAFMNWLLKSRPKPPEPPRDTLWDSARKDAS